MIFEVFDSDRKKLLSKDINKCPAVMFAVKRTHSVIGRIIVLMISTTTMKFISWGGVLCGVRWIISLLGFFVILNRIDSSHIVIAIPNVNVPCDVEAIVCGKSAIKFSNSKINIVVWIILLFPFFSFIRAFLSFLKFLFTLLIIWLMLVFVLFIWFIKIKMITMKEMLFIFIKDEDGSKIENMFVIIYFYS